MKKLKSLCLITPDVPGLCDFYARVLELTPEGDRSFAIFSMPDIHLTIAATEILEQMAPGFMVDTHASHCFLEFEVEDVDREYERLKALNVEVIKPPTTQPWGLRSVWFHDPQGNLVNFFAQVTRSEAHGQ